AAVALGVLDQTDADALIARARPDGWEDATDEQVTAVKAQLAREAETADTVTAGQQVAERLRHWRDRYVTEGDVPAPPSVDAIDAPEGFAFNEQTGRLEPVEDDE